jgi:hypothetical protein
MHVGRRVRGDQLVAPFGQPVLPEARESILAGLVLGDACLDHPAVGSGASGWSQRSCESVGRIGLRMDAMGSLPCTSQT